MPRRWQAKLAAATTPAAIDQLWPQPGRVRSRSPAGRRCSTRSTVARRPYGGLGRCWPRARHTVSVARGENLATGAVAVVDRDAHAQRNRARAVTAAGDQDARSRPRLVECADHPRRSSGRGAARPRHARALATVHNAAARAGSRASTRRSRRGSGRAARPLACESVAAQIATVERSVNAALTAVGCGHNVPNGKVIDVNLTTQSAVFYRRRVHRRLVAGHHRACPGCGRRPGRFTSTRSTRRSR